MNPNYNTHYLKCIKISNKNIIIICSKHIVQVCPEDSMTCNLDMAGYFSLNNVIGHMNTDSNTEITELDDLELPNIAKIVKTKSLTGNDLPRLANKEDYFIIEVTEIKEINKLKLFREKLILSIFFGDIKRL